jgi:hypothetical protein
MSDQNILQGLGLIFFEPIISFFDLLVPLKQAAINEEPRPAVLQEKRRTGHGPDAA